MTNTLTPDERALLTQLLAPRVRVLSDLAVARGLLVKVAR